MNLAEKPHENADFSVSWVHRRSAVFRISKPLPSKFITASSGDYSETSGTLYFSPGTTSKSVSVPVNSDVISEPNENFFLNLSGAENATVADEKGEGTIVDSPPPANGTPTASGDSYSTVQDKPLRVAAPVPSLTTQTQMVTHSLPPRSATPPTERSS